MDRKTAADIIHNPDPPSIKSPRTYRTHPDKLAPFWPEVDELLKNDSKLKAYAIFEEMLRRHPHSFDPAWKRTFERRVNAWKIEQRINKDVTFDQVHRPGDVLAVDFTSMNDLEITIAHQRFEHLAFHAVLTYSNWEYVDLCASESFEALAKGIQGAFQAIGGVTERIRNDSLSAAVNNLSSDRHFTANFTNLLNHLSVESHRINVRTPRENGDCESLHGHFKDYVDQRLRIRGSRDFDSQGAWLAFLRECIASKNAQRQSQFLTEQETLRELPRTMFPIYTTSEHRVSSNSLITVKQNRYSVPSCFIGSTVQIRVFSDEIELWHVGKRQLSMPRLIGKQLDFIDFRHVIDSLVRKPGAFANYRYREHMFPTLELRKAFDKLVDSIGQSNGVRVYLRLLQVGKNEGLASISPWVTELLTSSQAMSKKSLLASLDCVHATVPAIVANEVNIEAPDLELYDDFLEHKEVLDEPNPEYELDDCNTAVIRTGFPFETASFTDDASNGDQPVGASCGRELDALEVSQRANDSGMRSTSRESNPARVEAIRAGTPQDLGSDRLEATSVVGSSADGPTSSGRVPQGSEQSTDLRSPGFGEDVVAQLAWGSFGAGGSHGLSGALCQACPASSVGQAGATTTAVSIEAREVLGIDYRRSWLCSAEPRRDGSIVHVDRGPVRAYEHLAEQQSSVFEMGTDLQRSDDDSRRDRSLGASQCDPGAERPELSPGASEEGTVLPSPHLIVLNQETFYWGNLTVAKVQF
jgi:hypothetical protein